MAVECQFTGARAVYGSLLLIHVHGYPDEEEATVVGGVRCATEWAGFLR